MQQIKKFEKCDIVFQRNHEETTPHHNHTVKGSRVVRENSRSV
jgi:hypothetical protein